MAIRYQEPVLIARDALLEAQADFLSRMLLQFTQESAVETPADTLAALADLTARWGMLASSFGDSAQARSASCARGPARAALCTRRDARIPTAPAGGEHGGGSGGLCAGCEC